MVETLLLSFIAEHFLKAELFWYGKDIHEEIKPAYGR